MNLFLSQGFILYNIYLFIEKIMKYSAILLLACFIMPVTLKSQVSKTDSIALYVLEQTNNKMRSLQSCSFTAHISYDVWLDELGYIKHSNENKVSLKFPDKLKVNLDGDDGHKVFLYDGNNFSYYSYGRNQYSIFPLPKKDVVQVMDTINRLYDIDFPGADFFYSSFVQDVVDTGAKLIFLGMTDIYGKSCFHIAGRDVNGTGFQFWIAAEDYFLPIKMVLVYNDENGQSQYEATYSDWNLNPNIPDSMFEFSIPPKATKVRLVQNTTDQKK